MSKQDRQGARTPANLEQKYNFGATFAKQKKANSQYSSDIAQQRMTSAEFFAAANEAIADLREQLSTVENNTSVLRTDLKAAEDEISGLKKSIDSLNEWVAEAISTFNDHGSRLTGIETRLTTAEETIKNHEGRLATAEASVTNLSTKVTTNESDIASLKSRVSALEDTIYA